MEEIRIWTSSEDSVNLVTNVGVSSIENAIKKFKRSFTIETGELEAYLKGYFGESITIIPREVEEIDFRNI